MTPTETEGPRKMLRNVMSLLQI